MKILSYLLISLLFTSCFGLFDSGSKSVKLNPSGSGMSGMLKKRGATNKKKNVNAQADQVEQVEEVQEDFTKKIVVVSAEGATMGANRQIDQSELAKAISSLSTKEPLMIFVTSMLSKRDPAKEKEVIAAMESVEAPIYISGLVVERDLKYPVVESLSFGDNDGFIKDVTTFVIPERTYFNASQGFGYLDLVGEEDNYNNMPLVLAKNGKLYPTIPFKIVEMALGETPIYYKQYLTIGEKPLKLDATGSFGTGDILDFVKTSYASLSSADLQGKIVILDSGLKFPYKGKSTSIADIVASKAIEVLNSLK